MADDNLDVGAEDGKKGGKKKLIIILVAVLLVLGLGGGAAFYFLMGEEDEAVADPEVAAATTDLGASTDGPAIYLDLDPAFVIDFMVAGKQRYLQLNLTVKSRDSVQVDALKVHMPLIRNSLVLLFASQGFDDLQTLSGKMTLKAACVDAINNILTQETGKGGVEDVLFTNFVMQ
jgi:flagellar FliL protein